MTLSKSEKQFLHLHGQMLKNIMSKRLEDMKSDVFRMTKGDNRDYLIDFVDEMDKLSLMLFSPEPKRKDWAEDV